MPMPPSVESPLTKEVRAVVSIVSPEGILTVRVAAVGAPEVDTRTSKSKFCPTRAYFPV